MAAPSYTYSLSNGSTADASQVMQNYNDILNGVTDGTKDLTISALTCNGAVNMKAAVTLGASTANDITFTGSLATTIPIKTDASFDIGTSSKGLRSAYFGGNSQRVNITASASMSATWTLTLPVTAGTNNYVMATNGSGVSSWVDGSALVAAGSGTAGIVTTGTQTIAGAKTFSTSVTFANGATALTWYEEGTITPTVAATGTSGTPTPATQVGSFTRIGRRVFFSINITWTNWTGSPTGTIQIGGLPYAQKNTANLYPPYVILMDNVNMPTGTLWVVGQPVVNALTFNLVATKCTPGVSAANSVSVDPSTNAGSATRGIFASGSYDV